MDKIRIITAVFACKLTRLILRILKRGGTALPGKIAVAICPGLLMYLAKNVDCIVITGTNGKTTSARMLEQFFIDSGASYFANKSGSNLMQGIAAEFALNATATGKPKRDHAVIECDEAAAKRVCEYLDPRVVLVTNVFSDQVDRFHDVGETLECIRNGVKNSPNATVCLNADDPLTASIADEVPDSFVLFGMNKETYKNRAEAPSGAPGCVRCDGAMEYEYVTYGHLGGFRCPSCGYARKSPDVAVTEIVASDADTQTIKINICGEIHEIVVNLPGEYNIYNAAGVIAAAVKMGFPVGAVKTAMRRFECGFGRMEKLDLGGRQARIILVKNAAGCNQVLEYLCSLPGKSLFVICLNDKIADGADISWINDARFEKLLDMGDKLCGVLVSGSRAADMLSRLEFAGLGHEKARVFKSMDDMLDAALAYGEPIYFMPTYTAMLEIRARLSRRFGIKDFWE